MALALIHPRSLYELVRGRWTAMNYATRYASFCLFTLLTVVFARNYNYAPETGMREFALRYGRCVVHSDIFSVSKSH